MTLRFRDRRHAGRVLADRLAHYAQRPDVLVLALPRGGVPVAFEVARALQKPLDVVVVRKLGVPGEEELAMGAVGSGGARVLNEPVVSTLNIPPAVIDAISQREQAEVQRQERLYRADRPAVEIGGRTVILVDDGLATGTTIGTAALALRRQQPAWLVIAVPVAPREACYELKAVADDVICVSMPEDFVAVGDWYDDFPQITDDEVRELLRRAAADRPHAA